MNIELILPSDAPIMEKDIPLGRLYIDGSGRLCMTVLDDDSMVVLYPQEEIGFFSGRQSIQKPIKMLVSRARIEVF